MCLGLLVPPVKGRKVAGVPSLAESGGLQIPIGTYLARHRPEVVPKIGGGGASPEPITVIDTVNDEPRFEYERVGNHGIVLRVRVFYDVEILLNRPAWVGEECPLGSD